MNNSLNNLLANCSREYSSGREAKPRRDDSESGSDVGESFGDCRRRSLGLTAIHVLSGEGPHIENFCGAVGPSKNPQPFRALASTLPYFAHCLVYKSDHIAVTFSQHFPAEGGPVPSAPARWWADAETPGDGEEDGPATFQLRKASAPGSRWLAKPERRALKYEKCAAIAWWSLWKTGCHRFEKVILDEFGLTVGMMRRKASSDFNSLFKFLSAFFSWLAWLDAPFPWCFN